MPKYQVIHGLDMSPDGIEEAIIIQADEIAGGIGEEILTWREAKKALRAYYLDKAKSLRSVTEKDYFK